MDNDLVELADRLCVLAGMIMEDHNPLAVSTIVDQTARLSKLDTLATAAEDLTVLIAAAKALVRLG
ncbi:MAG: hypothetical protein AB7G25_02760 [Sphingomonadaceae bacterium]